MTRLITNRLIASVIALLSIVLPLSAASAGDDMTTRTQLAWVAGPTWYAIAGSYHSKREADAKASRLGDPWIVQDSNICDNFTPRIWMVVAGAYNGGEARALARRVHGYAKECK
jgi:hypothetical protein